MAKHPTTQRLMRRVVLRTLAEVVPPLAITSIGRGMVLVGQGMEVLGQMLQTGGARVEQFGHEQALRSANWLPPTPTTVASNPPA